MKKRAMILGSTLSALALLLGPMCPDAHAATIGGYSGRWATGVSDQPCFLEYWGGVKNTCSGGVRGWNVPLQVSAAGYYTPRLYFNLPSSSATTNCIVYASDSVGNVSSSAYSSAAGPGTKTITPGTVYVPTNGFLYTSCWMSQNALLINVAW